jgi:hypothetical protein
MYIGRYSVVGLEERRGRRSEETKGRKGRARKGGRVGREEDRGWVGNSKRFGLRKAGKPLGQSWSRRYPGRARDDLT